MSNQTIKYQVPDYIASAKPNPRENRAPWYKNTAPSYAGIFLWFVFWQDAMKADHLGGGLAAGIGTALISLLIAGLVCHFFFYLVPGLLGMKTGLPLYVVGSSVFGAEGGLFLPGFLMGILQFGWLGVNTYFSSTLLVGSDQTILAKLVMVVWAVLAAFVGLKGIQYVARVATYIPLIPFVILIAMFVKTASGLGSFDPQALITTHKSLVPNAPSALSTIGVLAFVLTYVVGFFATAGAAGVDFGLNNRNTKDVQWGGLIGIALAILVTAGLSALVVAGAHGISAIHDQIVAAAKANPKQATDLLYQSTSLMKFIFGENFSRVLWVLLALAAFPPACFSSFVAANSFKTTMPKVNPFLSVGIGTLVSIILAVTTWAKDVVTVFQIIGASFGPICGAMFVDYLLAGHQWSGPRKGWNPAGWVSWALGFIVGILPTIKLYPLPAAPVFAFIVGAVVYWICMKAGMSTEVIPWPQEQKAEQTS